MKSLTLLIFVVGCTTAFGQAQSMASNSNGLRDYSKNAVAIGYMSSAKADSKAPSVAQDFESLSKQSDTPDSKDLSVLDIKAILENRMAMADRASVDKIEVATQQ